ncbi:MAG TPA: glutamate-cysteine ligase family protein, partial [Candidatus Polarisedimenticolaceae bacterium]|nr:glutamate-cysteine ligase family protein [Candidatus Polarisedimenticolaceae bacterium]
MAPPALLDYFLSAAKPRADWVIGAEVEKLGRDAQSGLPLPYEGPGASVRAVLEHLLERRGGSPVFEAEHLIGLDGPWGSISLEPGGQVEWSSRPQPTLQLLAGELDAHLAALAEAGRALGVRWLDVAVDPVHPVSAMRWMPKARYGIMRPFLGARGRLAHRMMTQTASIQCAFDFSDPADWRRKFKAAALLAPVAVALFANSSRVDGTDSGWRSFRTAIWRETDPDRCELPPVVFEPAFDLERWVDWMLDVPTIFLRRCRGLVSADGVPFRRLIGQRGSSAHPMEDWENHVSTIFTDVRCYTYIEVRSADLQPDARILAVPALWTGILYDDDACRAALELGAGWNTHAAWREAMEQAARHGLDGRAAGR